MAEQKKVYVEDHLQRHIDQHIREENEFIKTIYAEKKIKFARLKPHIRLRMNDCNLRYLICESDNVVHMYKGSIRKFIMTDGIAYFDGVDGIKILKATNSRIRLSDTIGGEKTKIKRTILDTCEYDAINIEYNCSADLKEKKGPSDPDPEMPDPEEEETEEIPDKCIMFEVKNSRINIKNCKIEMEKGGDLDGGSFCMEQTKVILFEEGWKIKNLDCQFSSNDIKVLGKVPILKSDFCNIILANSKFLHTKIHFEAKKSSLCTNDSEFKIGEKALVFTESGNMKIIDCDFKDQELVNVELEGMSCLWSGGKAKSAKENIVLDKSYLFIHKGTTLKATKANIKGTNFAHVYGNDIELRTDKPNCDASDQTTMEFVNCNFTAEVGFDSDESTFFIRGSDTNLNHETTAKGSGTFIIDDEEGVYF